MQRRPITRQGKSRQGAAMVEFAIVLPLFMAAILGILEFGRAFMVNQVVISASRAGVRKAVIEGTTEADVKTAINDEITANLGQSLTSTTVTFSVDGATGELSSASRGDQVGVRVAVPFSSVAFTSPLFLANATLSGECVMRRE